MPFPFVNPWMLAGLSAVAIPLLLRLFARREYVVVPWGAMRFLAAASDRRARLPRTEWLLMALRMGVLALLALAFARPWIAESSIVPPGTAAHRDLVIIIDGSASMSARTTSRQDSVSGDKETMHQRAIRQAALLMDPLKRGDTVTLIDARDEPRIISPRFADDFAAARTSLDELPPSRGPANLLRAVTRAVSLLDHGKNLSQEIIVLTDGQRAAWPTGDSPQWNVLRELRALARVPPRLFVWDVSETPGWPGLDRREAPEPQSPETIPARSTTTAGESNRKENLAVGPLWSSRTVTAAGLPVRVGATLYARGNNQPRTVTVHLEADGQHIPAQTKQITLAPDGDNDVSFECRFDTPGAHTVAIAVEADNRPADNRAECRIEVLPPISVLLVDGASSDEESRGETFFAAHALGHETTAIPWFRTTVVRWDDWQPAQLTAPAVVLLANVPGVTETQATWLEQHVKNGGGLLVALGGRVETESYNKLLHRDGEGLLPAPLQDVKQTSGDEESATIDIVNAPFVATGTLSPTSDVTKTRVSSWWSVGSVRKGAVEARLKPSGDPLLISVRQAAGRALWLTVPLNTTWSDLPTRQDFVPLLHEMIFSLVTPVDTPPTPGEHTTPAELQRNANERAEASVSQLDPTAREQLAEHGAMTFCQSHGELFEAWLHGRQPVEFWRWLLLGSVLLLAVETGITYRVDRRRRAFRSELDSPSAQSGSGVRALQGALRVASFAVIGSLLFEPVFRWTSEDLLSGRVVVAIDVSESMDAGGSDNSPLEVAAHSVATVSRSLAQTLPESVDVEYLAFGGRVESVDPRSFSPPSTTRTGSLADRNNPPQNSSGLLDELRDADPVLANSTDVAGLMNNMAAMATNAADSAHPLLAVLLLTDGRNTEYRDVLRAAERLAASAERIIPVRIAANKVRPNAAVVSVDVPRMVFAGEQARITANIVTEGLQNVPLSIVVRSADGALVEKAFKPAGPESSIDLELPAGTAGLHEFTLHIAEEGSEQPDDDSHTFPFSLRVVDDKARVMMLEGEARWEFRALESTLGRDEWIDWQPIVFRQPYVGVLPDTFFPRRLDLSPGMATSADSPFADRDLVIVGDVAPEDISAQAWSLLENFVAEQGGTLLFLAGRQNASDSIDSPIARRLLPVTNIHPIPLGASRNDDGGAAPRTFHLQPTIAAKEHPAFRLDNDPVRNRDIWSKLPGHSWGLTGRPKPGASVLATAIVEADEQPKSSDETVADPPAIVAQRYGIGEVIWFGFDSTWRWRRRDDQKHLLHFWSHLARAAARNRTLFGTGDLRFGPVDADVIVGEEVTLRMQLSPSRGQQLDSSALRAEIRRAEDDQIVRVWKFEPVNQQPLMREARGRSLPEGEYRIHLIADDTDVSLPAITAPLRVRPQRSRERIDLRADDQLLEQIAAIGQSEVLRPDQFDRLTSLMPAPTTTRTETREFRPWNHATVLLLLFLLLSVEWGLRQRMGLP